MPLLANLIIETFQPTPDASLETICRALNHGAPGGPDGWFSMAAPSPSELPVRTLRAWSRCCRCSAARAAGKRSSGGRQLGDGALQSLDNEIQRVAIRAQVFRVFNERVHAAMQRGGILDHVWLAPDDARLHLHWLRISANSRRVNVSEPIPNTVVNGRPPAGRPPGSR
jgi:hypothetical protein